MVSCRLELYVGLVDESEGQHEKEKRLTWPCLYIRWIGGLFQTCPHGDPTLSLLYRYSIPTLSLLYPYPVNGLSVNRSIDQASTTLGMGAVAQWELGRHRAHHPHHPHHPHGSPAEGKSGTWSWENRLNMTYNNNNTGGLSAVPWAALPLMG